MNKRITSIFLICFLAITLKLSAQDKTLTYKTLTNVSYSDIHPGTQDNYMKERCVFDFYYPENKQGFATIIWFHGGGLTGGNKFIPEVLKNKGYAVLAANYRLYPKVKCPGYIEDAAAVIAWAFRNIEKYGGDPHKIIVSGHSAGAYLTCMVGLDKSYLAPYSIDANQIFAMFSFSAQAITHFSIRDERGIKQEQPVVDKYAPMFHVRPDASPLILMTGDREKEMLGRYEENAYFWRMMKIAGSKQTSLYEFDGFDHGSMCDPGYLLMLDQLKKLIKDN